MTDLFEIFMAGFILIGAVYLIYRSMKKGKVCHGCGNCKRKD
ncbi:hypothetical protein [Thermodesulfovibrio hydrogeniphilus]